MLISSSTSNINSFPTRRSSDLVMLEEENPIKEFITPPKIIAAESCTPLVNESSNDSSNDQPSSSTTALTKAASMKAETRVNLTAHQKGLYHGRQGLPSLTIPSL